MNVHIYHRISIQRGESAEGINRRGFGSECIVKLSRKRICWLILIPCSGLQSWRVVRHKSRYQSRKPHESAHLHEPRNILLQDLIQNFWCVHKFSMGINKDSRPPCCSLVSLFSESKSRLKYGFKSCMRQYDSDKKSWMRNGACLIIVKRL